MDSPSVHSEPILIQGGMGVGVSDWRLARAVSQTGQLGVVSGTAIDVVLTRRLQCGDPGGHLRRALGEFPYPEMAARIIDRYFVPGGKSQDSPFPTVQVLPAQPSQQQLELVVAANFVEVFLAKEGHDGLVGINYLEKIQTPTLPSLFGAMLAGVDYVLMGAGIPRTIPGTLDALAEGHPVELPLTVSGAKSTDNFVTRFDPVEFSGDRIPWLERPKFLAIVGATSLAMLLVRKSNGRVDGFVVESSAAGGHNTPPRGKSVTNERGEPVYGKSDQVDIGVVRSLGRPFWLAGSFAGFGQLQAARDLGAAGVQVGTAFAFCEESGLRHDIRQRVLQMCRLRTADVVTDLRASPTGFPFKVLQLADSLSDARVHQQRQRICDLGFLRHAYRRQDGTLGWRCPGEAVCSYARKGGDVAETEGRKCLCNGLTANIGLQQIRPDGRWELPIVTCGDDVQSITRFLPSNEATSYSAADVVSTLLAEASSLVASQTY